MINKYTISLKKYEDHEVKTNEYKTKVKNNSFVDIKDFEAEILEFPEVKIDSENEVQEYINGDTEVKLSEKEFVDANETYNITSSKMLTLCTIYIKVKLLERVELKFMLNDLNQKFKDNALQNELKELQCEIKQLQEIEKLLDDSDEVSLITEKYFQKEIVELPLRLQPKPELFQNVKLNFEWNKLNKKFKNKLFNLFNKLQLIHIKQSIKFAYSNKSPENVNKYKFILYSIHNNCNSF